MIDYTKTLELLKENKIKLTPQRIGIIDFLANNPIHPSAETIYDLTKKKHPSISLSTVYNTLELLEKINRVLLLNIPGNNKVYYEFNTTYHQHFYCNNCESIFDIWPNSTKDMVNSIDGHKIEETYTYYKGICKDCKTNNHNKKEVK
jgi:Fur family transcriptional regulator, peroxide stress response regulator